MANRPILLRLGWRLLLANEIMMQLMCSGVQWCAQSWAIQMANIHIATNTSGARIHSRNHRCTFTRDEGQSHRLSRASPTHKTRMPVERSNKSKRWIFIEFRTRAELDRNLLSEAIFDFSEPVFSEFSVADIPTTLQWGHFVLPFRKRRRNDSLWRGSATLDPAQAVASMVSERHCASEQGRTITEKRLR